ncbi:MAG TPA: thiamine pyrophosphate-dependent enzyme [Thermomicrobiaceae bacterium]|nr:thiamine pyrophosphate-dependent enzyme [Thermomicrobiaceae bacterium]
MAKTTADLLIERLIAWGVDTIFGLPGDGINGIFEALRTHQDKLKFIQVRHEESAAFAACGYAKYTGRLGVCLATSGPGGIHLLNGLYDANMDGQPVLAITGHTFHDLIGTHQQQDVDLDKLFMDVSVYNERIMGPAHVANVVDEAIKAAMGHHGVAHITIPKDMQDWSSDDAHMSMENVPMHSSATFDRRAGFPDPALLKEAAALINSGKKVAILAGRGCLSARDEVLQLADLVAGPIVKPLLGKAVVPDDSPFTTGGIGLLGTAASQEAMQECDTLIIAGSSFPYIQFLPKPGQARCVQIDRDPERIGLRYPAEVGLVGDCKLVLQALIPQLEHKSKRDFLEQAQERMKDWNELMEHRGTRRDTPMKPQVVAYELDKAIASDAIVSSDSGTIATWSARYIKMRDERMFSLSGTLATMANGLPYCIGAAVGYPGRQVVGLVGDGGFTMLMGELATLKKYDLNVKLVIIKNNSLGQIKWEQMVLEGNPEFGVDLQPIDFEMYAKAVGIAAYTIDDPEKCGEVMKEACSQPGPVLIQAVVDPQEPPLPGKITTEQAKKFAESLLRGEKYRSEIITTVIQDVLKNKIREVV